MARVQNTLSVLSVTGTETDGLTSPVSHLEWWGLAALLSEYFVFALASVCHCLDQSQSSVPH